MGYIIKTVSDETEIEKGMRADINIENWGGEYHPVAYAKLVFIKDKGFFLRIACEEQNPKAVFTKQNEMVCRDSCLEFFANMKPMLPDSGYMNFEGNANGSLLACYGKNIRERSTFVALNVEHPKAVPFQNEKEWGYTMLLPLASIKAIYGNADFKKGDIIKGSFFKCGDETAVAHYLSYNKIEWECPAFHRPEFFVDMVIE